MANKVFGEARLDLADGRELTVRFDFNALVEAEEACGMKTREIMGGMATGDPPLKVVRALLYAGLRYHHKGIALDEAGDLFLTDDEAINEALGAAMVEMADRREAVQNPQPGPRAVRPAPRPRGIGTHSSKRGVKAA